MARRCDLREMKPRCCRRARLAAPPPPPSMHVHRAGLLHPNQYHTLSQKTDPTRAGLCTLQPARPPRPSRTETFELDGGADGAAAADAADAAVVLGAFPKPGKPRRVRCRFYYLRCFKPASAGSLFVFMPASTTVSTHNLLDFQFIEIRMLLCFSRRLQAIIN